MARINRNVGRFAVSGEEGGEFSISYDNRGDPYREGVEIEVVGQDHHGAVSRVFLEEGELRRLSEFLCRLLGGGGR